MSSCTVGRREALWDNSAMRIKSSWLVWALVALASGAAGAYFASQHDSAPVRLASGTWLPQPRPVPQFALTDQAGDPFSNESLRGQPTLVFFGFTNCPHICPTTLAMLAQVKREARVPGLRVVLVSVDPERDTPAVLASYLRAFDPQFIGLTGDKAAIERLAANLGVAVGRSALPGGSYTVDHTSAVFLVDARGELVAVFTPPIESPALAGDLRTIAARLQAG
jgi:protein SCO1